MGMWRLSCCLVMLQVVASAKVEDQKVSGPGQPPQQLLIDPDETLGLIRTCESWTAWLPPRINPAVVVQAISAEYADVERNFITVMEANSRFSRDNLYLLCLDAHSLEVFQAMEIQCVYVGNQKL